MKQRRSRSDSTRAEIVKAVRLAGWETWDIGYPCDLLCYRAGMWKTLECKPPKNKRNEPKLRKEQTKQASFCERTNTPYVVTAEQALEYLK